MQFLVQIQWLLIFFFFQRRVSLVQSLTFKLSNFTAEPLLLFQVSLLLPWMSRSACLCVKPQWFRLKTAHTALQHFFLPAGLR